MNKIVLLFALLAMHMSFAQELPFREIPENPETLTPATITARMIEGLGFRYYWATENLRVEDLSYKPSTDARSFIETTQHIFGLVNVISNCIDGKENTGVKPSDNIDELRKNTLEMLAQTAQKLRNEPEMDLSKLSIVFPGKNNSKTAYPFWNLLNGPIEDAVWHVGQLISFRRASGNPYNAKAGVLTGKVTE